MVASLPITSSATWLTASGITGLTLPGMMLEPACRRGSRISPSPASGPGAQQPQVAADLEQVHGVRLEDARDLDEHVGVLRGLDQVLGAREAHAGELAQSVDDAEDVLARRRETGADGGAAEVDHAQALLALVDAPAVAVEGLGVGAHLAPQRGEHGVLVLRAPDLDDVGELLLLLLEGLLQGDDLLFQPVQERDRRQAQRGGEGVVGALVEVDVVQRRDAVVGAERLAEQLQGAVGQHLVDVHVGAGAGAALQAVDDDLGRERAFGQLAAGVLDGVRLGVVAGPRSERAVGARAGELDHAEGARELRVYRLARQREVLERALGVRAVQALRRHGDLAEQVALDPRVAVWLAASVARTPSSARRRLRRRRAWPSSPRPRPRCRRTR